MLMTARVPDVPALSDHEMVFVRTGEKLPQKEGT